MTPGRDEAGSPSTGAARPGLRPGAWVATTYFAEGLPYSVVHQVATQLFTALNASLPAIGHTSLFGLAWNLKFLWSPLVDLVGTARRWLVALEVLLALAIAAVAWTTRSGSISAVAALLAVVSVIAATHDIAIDGHYLRALDGGQQARFAGLRVAVYRVALLVGNGVLVWIGGKVSWVASFALAAAMLGALAVFHQAALPRAQEARARGSPGEVGAAARDTEGDRGSRATAGFWRAFATFFTQPGAAHAVAFIVLFRLGDAMLFSMSAPLLRDLGLGTAARGIVSGLGGTAIGIAGSMIAAHVVAKRGLGRTLLPITIVQAAALPVYALLAWARPPTALVVAAVLVEHLAAGVGTAGFSVFLMRRCSGAYKATHFAIATALMSIPATASALSGHLAQAVGYPVFFCIASAGALPGLVLAWWIATGERIAAAPTGAMLAR
jgi:PAT family beta-lactamase induction signal transducer AmpG